MTTMTTPGDTSDAIAAAFRGSREALTEFDALAHKIARGHQDVKADVIARTCGAARKTEACLRENVLRHGDVIECQRRASLVTAARKLLADLDAKTREADSRLDRAKAEHRAAILGLGEKRSNATLACQLGEQAVAKLRGELLPDWAQHELAALQEQAWPILQRQRFYEAEAARLTPPIAEDADIAAGAGTTRSIELHRSKIAALNAQREEALRRATAAGKALQADLDRLNARREELWGFYTGAGS